jgi:hypothetical protein
MMSKRVFLKKDGVLNSPPTSNAEPEPELGTS